ncbi:MAG: CARDB domain-containing protein, partial [Ilumatobacteraceae bacterium]
AGPATSTRSPSPDLRVTDLTAPAEADEGAVIEVTWTVTNDGEAVAPGTWRDLLVLRNVADLTVPPVTLGSFSYESDLGPGFSYTRTERVRLPAKTEGVWRITVTTDSGNAVYEGTAEANNALGDDQPITLSLLPRADLQVQTIEAPDRVQAGATMAVAFEIVNRGSVATPSRWNDKVYLSLDNKPGADDILIGSFDNGAALAPDEAYRTTSSTIIVPERFRGTGYVLVIADANSQVDEYPAPYEANNFIAREIYVEPQPLSDLVTGTVVAPAQAVYGSEIEVRFTVTNQGSAATNRTAWTDTVWLTRDRTRPNPGGNGGILLGSIAHDGALAVGEGYDVVLKVRIPAQIESGIYYITPWSDAYDVVFEDTLASNLNPDDPNEFDNNNYKARQIDIIGTPVPPKPDLQVTAVTTNAPGSVDGPFTVTWTVANRGEGNAPGNWTDTVLLHSTPDWRSAGAQVWTLGTFTRPEALDSLAAYTRTESFDLSPAAHGLYVTVLTDTSPPPSSVIETREDNNSRTVEAVVTKRGADLVVTAVSAPTQNFSGEKTTITWTVRNDGSAVWAGTRLWTDTVWISPDPVFIPERATRIGAASQPAGSGLGSGQSYTATADVVLPRGIGGDYFIYIIADDSWPEENSGENWRSYAYYGTHVFEDGATANNLGQGTIPVTYREPDLTIRNLTIPPGELLSGQTITVNFDVVNLGTRDTREGRWYDRLYLSK